MTNRKRYTREFKLEAVRLLETSDKPNILIIWGDDIGMMNTVLA